METQNMYRPGCNWLLYILFSLPKATYLKTEEQVLPWCKTRRVSNTRTESDQNFCILSMLHTATLFQRRPRKKAERKFFNFFGRPFSAKLFEQKSLVLFCSSNFKFPHPSWTSYIFLRIDILAIYGIREMKVRTDFVYRRKFSLIHAIAVSLSTFVVVCIILACVSILRPEMLGTEVKHFWATIALYFVFYSCIFHRICMHLCGAR